LDIYAIVLSTNIAIVIMLIVSVVTVGVLLTVEQVKNEKIAELVLTRFEDIVLHAAKEAPIDVIVKLDEVSSEPVEIKVNKTTVTVRVFRRNIVVSKSTTLPTEVEFNYTGLLPASCILHFRELGNNKVIINVERC